MTRGVVLGLSLAQVAQRARYLGQLVASDQLDEHVRRDGSVHCPDGCSQDRAQISDPSTVRMPDQSRNLIVIHN